MLTELKKVIDCEPALKYNLTTDDLYYKTLIKVSCTPYTRNEWEDNFPLWCHNFRLITYGDEIGDFENFIRINAGNLVLVSQITNRELIPYKWQGKLVLAVK